MITNIQFLNTYTVLANCTSRTCMQCDDITSKRSLFPNYQAKTCHKQYINDIIRILQNANMSFQNITKFIL